MKVKRKQKNNAIQSLELYGQKGLRYDIIYVSEYTLTLTITST